MAERPSRRSSGRSERPALRKESARRPAASSAESKPSVRKKSPTEHNKKVAVREAGGVSSRLDRKASVRQSGSASGARRSSRSEPQPAPAPARSSARAARAEAIEPSGSRVTARRTSSKRGVESEKPAATSSRSSSRSSVISSRESSTSGRRSSRRGRESESTRSAGETTRRSSRAQGGSNQKLMLYGGIGLGVLGLVLVAVGFSSGDKTSRRASAQVGSSAPARPAAPKVTPYVKPDAEPFANESDARKAIREARDLIHRAQNEEGQTRNNDYRRAEHLCERVLVTTSLEHLHAEAGKLKYDAMKHQTN